MILYTAGNFPQMTWFAEERSMKEIALEISPAYNRLLSFYYTEKTERVISVKRSHVGDENIVRRSRARIEGRIREGKQES